MQGTNSLSFILSISHIRGVWLTVFKLADNVAAFKVKPNGGIFDIRGFWERMGLGFLPAGARSHTFAVNRVQV